MSVPADVRDYVERLVERLRSVLADRLIAVYGLGSLALGGFDPHTSDLDLYAVVAQPLEHSKKLAIASACRQTSIACPARRLELVVISAAAARNPGPTPRWELNLNTGPGEADHVGLEAHAEPSHWFVLDLAIAHRHGLALLGPPAHELIGWPDEADINRAQREAMAWYARHGTSEERALAARRAEHWRHTGRFVAKRNAGGFGRTA